MTGHWTDDESFEKSLPSEEREGNRTIPQGFDVPERPTGLASITTPERNSSLITADLEMAGTIALYYTDAEFQEEGDILIHEAPSQVFLDNLLVALNEEKKPAACVELLTGLAEVMKAKSTDDVLNLMAEFWEKRHKYRENFSGPPDKDMAEEWGSLQSVTSYLRTGFERCLDRRFDKIILLHEGGDFTRLGLDFRLYLDLCIALEKAEQRLLNNPHAVRTAGPLKLKTGFSGQVSDRLSRDIMLLKARGLALLT